MIKKTHLQKFPLWINLWQPNLGKNMLRKIKTASETELDKKLDVNPNDDILFIYVYIHTHTYMHIHVYIYIILYIHIYIYITRYKGYMF